jgi:hypothetical protein
MEMMGSLPLNQVEKAQNRILGIMTELDRKEPL